MDETGVRCEAVEERSGQCSETRWGAVGELKVEISETRGDGMRNIEEDLADAGVALQDELMKVGE